MAKKGCLCKDGKKYSVDCCDSELINQGVGTLIEQGESVIVNTNTERVITNTN